MALSYKLHEQCRLLTQADIEEVMLVENQCYPFAWSKKTMLDCLGDTMIPVAVTEKDHIVGYVILSYGAQESHVLNICVAPRFRGKQYGQLLLNEAFKIAKEKEADDIYLEVRESNTIAIALYYDLGFNEIGCGKGYYPAKVGREDAIVMAKHLF